MTFKPIEPHEGRSHAGTTQDLDEGPKLVGMVFGPHHQQICRFDSHARGGRRIEQLSPVEHDESSTFAAGLSGDHQGQALGAAPLFGSQPFDQAAAAKSGRSGSGGSQRVWTTANGSRAGSSRGKIHCARADSSPGEEKVRGGCNRGRLGWTGVTVYRCTKATSNPFIGQFQEFLKDNRIR